MLDFNGAVLSCEILAFVEDGGLSITPPQYKMRSRRSSQGAQVVQGKRLHEHITWTVAKAAWQSLGLRRVSLGGAGRAEWCPGSTEVGEKGE